MTTRVQFGAICLAILGACAAPVEDAPAHEDEETVAASSEELINGTVSSNNPTRNATVWVGGCSGTLVAPDIVVTAGHCLAGAAWEEEPVLGTGTWRPMAPQDVRVGPDPSNAGFQTWAYWMNQAGFDDIAMVLLAQPVPSSLAIPAKVMTRAEYERLGGTLSGKRLQMQGYGSECSGAFAPRAWGWATFTGGTPRGINTFAAQLDPRSPQPLAEGGDSGGSLLWWNSSENAFYLVGVFVGTPSGGDSCASPSAGRATLHLVAPWKEGDDDDKPNLSAWFEAEVSQNLPRARFQPAEGQDTWHGWFCVGDEECDVGDFDGDGKDDIITFVKGSYGDVHVGLSYGWRTWSGSSFPQAGRGFESSLWHGFFGIHDEQVRVMDFNGDGQDDIVAGTPWRLWVALAQDDGGFGSSWQAVYSGICAPGVRDCVVGNPRWGSADNLLSIDTDTGEAELWYPSGTRMYRSSFDTSAITGRCVAPARCQLADFDGDLDDDLIIFDGSRYGNVDVALSSRSRFQTPTRVLSSRCYDYGGSFRRDCHAADVDGDGATDDIVMFDRYYRRIHVATRDGSTYTTRYHWARNVCRDGHVCTTGDFNGDGLDDVVGFAKSSGAGDAGDVYVQSSTYTF